MQNILNIYRFIFCRKIFYRFNYHLYKISLRGIGVFNSEGSSITGETYFFQFLSKHIHITTIIDVGANTGGYAREIHAYFPKAIIYAFEPHPKTFVTLKSIAKQNNIKAYNYAVGSNARKVKLWDFADDAELKHTQPTSTLASLNKDVIEELHKQKAQGFTVQQITIDGFLKIEKIATVDFMKIDTEGTEYEVLLGASQALKKNKIHIIQFEFNEMNAYSKRFFKDFIDILREYKFYRLMPSGVFPLDEYKPSTHEIYGFQNIVAVSKEYSKLFDKL